MEGRSFLVLCGRVVVTKYITDATSGCTYERFRNQRGFQKRYPMFGRGGVFCLLRYGSLL